MLHAKSFRPTPHSRNAHVRVGCSTPHVLVTKPTPINKYGASKLQFENCLLEKYSLTKGLLQPISLRLSNMLGPVDGGGKFFEFLVKKCAARESVTLLSDSKRNFVAVADVVQVLAELCGRWCREQTRDEAVGEGITREGGEDGRGRRAPTGAVSGVSVLSSVSGDRGVGRPPAHEDVGHEAVRWRADNLPWRGGDLVTVTSPRREMDSPLPASLDIAPGSPPEVDGDNAVSENIPVENVGSFRSRYDPIPDSPDSDGGLLSPSSPHAPSTSTKIIDLKQRVFNCGGAVPYTRAELGDLVCRRMREDWPRELVTTEELNMGYPCPIDLSMSSRSLEGFLGFRMRDIEQVVGEMCEGWGKER